MLGYSSSCDDRVNAASYLLPACRSSLTKAGLWFDTISALLLLPENDILFGLNGVSSLSG